MKQVAPMETPEKTDYVVTVIKPKLKIKRLSFCILTYITILDSEHSKIYIVMTGIKFSVVLYNCSGILSENIFKNC